MLYFYVDGKFPSKFVCEPGKDENNSYNNENNINKYLQSIAH